MTSRFGVALRPEKLSELVPQVQAAEALGYQLIGVTESVALARDPLMALVVTAQNTQRALIGTLVTNPLVRHPMSLAAAAATLDELAPGRSFIGIATGFSGTLNLGLRPATLAHLEEYIGVVRALLEHGEATYQGEHLAVRWAPTRVPIYMAAHGPNTIRLAGRIADGVFIGMGMSPPLVGRCLQALGEGAEEAGRNASSIDMWWSCPWEIDSDSSKAINNVTWQVASAAWHLAYPTFRGKGVPTELHAPLRRMADAYNMMSHGVADASARERYARLAKELGVQDYLAERHAIAGSPEECRSKVLRLAQMGASQLMTMVRGPDYIGRMRQWHDHVMARLG